MIVLLQQVRPVDVQSISFQHPISFQQQLEEFLRQKQEKITTLTTFFNIPFKYEPQVSRDFHVLDLFNSPYDNSHLSILTVAQLQT
jgi:hypothetical protein